MTKSTLDKFCAVILSHGRADRVFTYETLRKNGYTGKIFIFLDNEDETIDEYKKLYGDQVVVFDKKEASKLVDPCDNFEGLRGVVYARNICPQMVKKLGYKYYVMLDDDYTGFNFATDGNYEYNRKGSRIKDLDKIFQYHLDYLIEADLYTIAFAQGGDFIGGEGSSVWKKKLARKAMNSFICDVNKPIKFLGRINEDVNAYVLYGGRGKLYLTNALVRLEQKATQSNSGGLTELYLDEGTYVKSFYSVIICPSCVTVNTMGVTSKRLHHRIKWANAVPMIVDEKHKKIKKINKI